MIAPLLLLGASGAMLTAAGLLGLSWRFSAPVRKRVQKKRGPLHLSLMDYLLDSLHAVGLPIDRNTLLLIGAAFFVAASIISYTFNIGYGPLLLLVVLVLGNMVIRIRASKVRRGITRQMPGFLDQLNRDVATGQGVETAFMRAVARINNPLQRVLQRVVKRRELGQELAESLHQEAALLKSFELELLSTIIYVNQQHGGSIKSALDSFINMLRQNDHNDRELKAMSGETRVTAWVLALVPVVVIGLVTLTNREFMTPMLESPGGRAALIGAVGMQFLGMFSLYRMLRTN